MKALFFCAAVTAAISSMVFGAEEVIKTPEQIQIELNQDEALFRQAEKMFNPWYAGPLLTGGSSVVPPGTCVMQPYIFLTGTYGAWDANGHSVSAPSEFTFNPSVSGIQFGLTDWMDLTFNFGGSANFESGESGGGFGDILLGLGFRLLKQGLHNPGIKFIFNETFPTGTYEGLNPNNLGLNSTGAGSFQSQFGLRIGKLCFWDKLHPTNFRASYSFTVPSNVHVYGLNAYGGAAETNGTVSPGYNQQLNAAIEYSFTQNWVFALDGVFTWTTRTTFTGTPGFTETGAIAKVGGGPSGQLSFAPAIEYNPSPNLNFLAGVWVDAYGYNTSKFVSGIISMVYAFNVKHATE
jgi:hypothetical protein